MKWLGDEGNIAVAGIYKDYQHWAKFCSLKHWTVSFCFVDDVFLMASPGSLAVSLD